MNETLKTFARDMQKMHADGKTLKEIAKWSYEQREFGLNVPYMAVAQTDENGIAELRASPVMRQHALVKLFDETAPGCKSLKRYTLLVNREGVLFTERLSKSEVVNVNFS